MISTDFAANESWDDAWISFQLLFQPWKWIHGNSIQDAKHQIEAISYKPSAISLFLTGRAALYYYLQSLNLSKNTDVIIQAFTCEAVPLPIIAAGLNPIYVDIEEETYSMDIEDLKKKLTPNAKVLILQHTFELTPKFRNEILSFAEEKNLIVLEDVAHGWNPAIFNAKSDKPSAISYLLSFGRSKAFSSVFGGAIVTTDATISTKLAEIEKQLVMPTIGFILRTLLYKPLTVCIKSTYDMYIGKILHKILNALHLLIPEITDKEKQGEYDPIFAKAYPNALAILLLHQLNKYEKTKMRRAENVKAYNDSFKSSLPTFISRFPYLVENRDELLKNAAEKNIFLGKWYDQVVAPKQLQLEKAKYSIGSCPNAEKISQKIINLPIAISNNQLPDILSLIKIRFK